MCVCSCPGKWTQIPKNEVHCPGFVWKNYGMYVVKAIIPENTQPLCRENPWKSTSCVKQIAISYATLCNTHRSTLDNKYVRLAFFFSNRSDTSTLLLEDAVMIPGILYLFPPNLAIKLSLCLWPISAENLSIDTRYVVCCSGWQNMPKTSQFLSLWQNLSKSERSEKKCIGRNTLQFWINSDSALTGGSSEYIISKWLLFIP